MPSYKVLTKGFHGGITYDPNGKRKVLHVEKAFKKVPLWLEALKPETIAEAGKRKAAEAKSAKAAVAKNVADNKEIQEASFLGEGESTKPNSNVETL